jgi:uncharacterized pyridoxal phosphate-containing UPF0001 family protein
LAEVIGLRTIVGNLVYAFTSDGKVTREQMASIVERADSTKIKRAIDFLVQVRNGNEPQAAGGRE